MKVLETRPVKENVLKNIKGMIEEKSKLRLKNEDANRKAAIENLVVFNFLQNPLATDWECCKSIMDAYPDLCATEDDVRGAYGYLRVNDRNFRKALSDWAYDFAQKVYEGMAGDVSSIENALKTDSQKCELNGKIIGFALKKRVGLMSLFSFIPHLNSSEMKSKVMGFGKEFCCESLRSILRSIKADITESFDDPEIEGMTDVKELRRKIYLSRQELEEYRSLVAAADAEFENKLEELKQQEIMSFFSALNNEKYGYLLDSVYLQWKACGEVRRNGEKLPYVLEGVPAFFDRFMQFIRDVGISPVTKCAPNSTQNLTLAQMEGFSFEPSDKRTKPVREGEHVKVKVVSSGWKLGNAIISNPVIHEEN
jgi:hypothetical protein